MLFTFFRKVKIKMTISTRYFCIIDSNMYESMPILKKEAQGHKPRTSIRSSTDMHTCLFDLYIIVKGTDRL